MRVGVRPGRLLIFSPRWDEEGVSVVFDKGSGDYWVIAEWTRDILEQLCAVPAAGGVPLESLSSPVQLPAGDLLSALTSLAEFGLVRLDDR